ncbi:MAG: DUF4835 family protein [Muribaculaceae bacterium]|nr:DUF4835 family protein [Muribaculaceae bacterium]
MSSVATVMSVLMPCRVHAQELNCQVEINSDQVMGTRTSVFETLQEAMNDYMNTTHFTNAQFSANEKIDCRMFFTIKEYDGEKMSGDLQLQYTRPVYNSSYTTTVFNFKDSKIEFTYQENEPLIYSVNNMESQLTAILNYYAFLIIAMDFDTFSPRGGDPYYDRLAQIVQMAQSAGETGWRAFEDTKNRSALLSVFTDQSTAVSRDMLYEYHRLGLDQMSVSPDKGREHITSALKGLKTIYDANSMSVGLSLFKDSKLDELINVYSEAPQSERDEVYELLHSIYPADNPRLEKIKTPDPKR